MTYFDTSLTGAPVAERNTDPILPEERFVFELVGFERSQPDQWHKNGGIKWSFAVYDQDGRPFEFQDEPYILWRTTNVNAKGEPLFTLGTQAHEFAEALLGRKLGIDAHFAISELHGKRFSSQIVWQPKKTKPTEKAAVLASLRHIAVGGTAPAKRPSQVDADASGDDIDKALMASKFEKKLERAGKKNLPNLSVFKAAYAEIASASLQDVEDLIDSIDAALDAMDD